MNETQRRISEYKKSLPKIKEKIAGMVVLLIVAATMLTTVTFAWTTLSINPEVRGATTSLTSNGNLEIALANGANSPGPTQLGDGDSEKELADRNITWGNLINLSDPSYGLEHFVLRPAQLNTGELDDAPLYGAEYDEFGRVVKLNTEFGYAKWGQDKDGIWDFQASTSVNDYGVRVISSITQSFEGPAKVYRDYYNLAKETNLAAATMYAALKDNNAQMQSLATMMGLYMTARMNPSDASLSNPTCKVEDIQNLRDMYAGFKEAFEKEAEAIAYLLNFQCYVMTSGEMYGTFSYKIDENGDPVAGSVLTLSAAKIKNIEDQLKEEYRKHIKDSSKTYLSVQKLDEFIKNYNTIASDLDKLEEIAKAGGTIMWKDSGLNSIVNNLVNVGECTIGKDNTPIKNVGASNATSYLSGTQEARITNGILYNFEERTGGYIEVKNLGISATVKRMGITVPATVKANIQTTASRDYNLFTQDLLAADETFKENGGSFSGGSMVANDTYGLAIDFWIRTNASGSFLTLEGNVLTETTYAPATTTDMNGNEQVLYSVIESVEAEDGSTTSLEIELYKIVTRVDSDTNGEVTENTVNITETTTWYTTGHSVYQTEVRTITVSADKTETIVSTQYYNNANNEITEDETIKPIGKMKEVVTVIGYEGENRVWEDKEGLNITNLSTTQGSGSCYVFYASPEDQARFLNLLQYLKIAFVDAENKLLTKAVMDTEHYYAKEGKVIVPIVLDSSSPVAGTTASGDPIYGITALEQNVATRITAIVYLDGDQLKNSDVLSSADIDGMMNIQFGSSADLSNADNEELRLKEISVSAALDETSFSLGDPDMTTNITLNVGGDQPKSIKAFFIRSINATQGTREHTVTFTYDETSGTWKAPYTFTAPGTYVLRSVIIDGADRDLTTPQTVTIEGFAIASFNWGETANNVTVRSAKASYSTNLELKFAANDAELLPKRVEGRFIREDGTVANALFTYNTKSATWSANVKFAQSGKYALQYLIVDGEYQELSEGMQKFINLYLGMKVSVYTTSPTSMKQNELELTKYRYVNLDNEIAYCYVVTTTENTYAFYKDGDHTVEDPKAKDAWEANLAKADDDTTKLAFGEMFEAIEQKNLNMQVKIVDDTGNVVAGLQNVRLTYSGRGSIVFLMDADLKWNSVSGYYEGTFDAASAEVGIYGFSSLDIGNDTITSTVSSVTFTIRAGDPPSFVSVGKSETDSNTIEAVIKDSSTTTVVGYFEHVGTSITTLAAGDGDEEKTIIEVMGTGGINGIWRFKVPDNAAEGYWKFVSIKIWNYTDKYEEDHLGDFNGDGYSELGNYYVGADYRDPDPMVFNEESEGWQTNPAMVIRHANKVYVTVNKSEAKTKYTGNNFLVPYTVDGSNISIKFADFSGAAINGVTSPQLTFTYVAGTEYIYGGYSASSILVDEIKIPLTTTDNLNYSLDLSAAPVFKYAGEYTAKITYTYNTKYETIDISSDEWKVEVYTNRPTVTITGVGLTDTSANRINVSSVVNNTFTTDNPSFISGQFNTIIDGNNAVVYIHTLPYSEFFGTDVNKHNLVNPTVTLKLSGVPTGFDEAIMEFGNSADSSYSSEFSFDATTLTATAEIGYSVDGEIKVSASDVKGQIFLAGKQTVNNFTITYDKISYTVYLLNAVTINQPQYPIYADFVIDSSKYPGTVPSRVYTTNGESITITLPGASEITTIWTEDKNDTSTSAFVEQSRNTTTYYETWNDDCDGAMYQKYDKYTIVTQAEETVVSYTRKFTITGWKVGNTTYALGETVTITESQTITAVISYDDGAKTTTANIITKTTKYFSTGSDTAGTPPSGYVNVTSDPDKDNKDRWTESSPNVTETRTPKN